MTAAHYQTVTLNTQLREWVPEHEPRETDPHYNLFRQAKVLLRKHNVPCWRCGVHYADLVSKNAPATVSNPLGAYQLEAHHNDLEFSLLNGVDVEKWWAASHEDPTGLVACFSDVDGWLARHSEMRGKSHVEIFNAYMESEGNLMQLCDVCHRSKGQGIHHIDYPAWRALRTIWRADDPAHIQ